MSFSLSSPPLTLGIPVDALGIRVDEQPPPSVTLIRRRVPDRSSEALEALDTPPSPVAVASAPCDPEGDASHAALEDAWQLAARIGQLLGSGTPRSLVVRGRELDVELQGPPPAHPIITRRCA